MQRIPRSGEFYRHFKNNLYQIVTVATHTETGGKLVVYQALYGDYGIYARPLEMFVRFYRHFKNNLYQIVTVATHTETGGKLVVYQALYGDYGIYARPLEMFVSEVDREKYPQAVQKYRFERVENPGDTQETVRAEKAQKEAGVKAVELGAAKQIGAAEAKAAETELDGVNPKLLAFLDADDTEEKYQILISMRDEIDDSLINNMAVAMDSEASGIS